MDKLQGTEGLQEAAGIAWAEVHGNFADSNGDVHPVKINLTSRADDPMLALANLMATIEFAGKEYGLYPWQASSKPAVVEALPKVEEHKPVAPVAPKPVTVGETFHAVKVAVTPQDNGRVKLDFYTDIVGKAKFPYLTAYPLGDEAVTWLGWDYSNFEKPGEFTMNHNITWVPSQKLNSKGNPYKNVTKIEAL